MPVCVAALAVTEHTRVEGETADVAEHDVRIGRILGIDDEVYAFASHGQWHAHVAMRIAAQEAFAEGHSAFAVFGRASVAGKLRRIVASLQRRIVGQIECHQQQPVLEPVLVNKLFEHRQFHVLGCVQRRRAFAVPVAATFTCTLATAVRGHVFISGVPGSHALQHTAEPARTAHAFNLLHAGLRGTLLLVAQQSNDDTLRHRGIDFVEKSALLGHGAG